MIIKNLPYTHTHIGVSGHESPWGEILHTSDQCWGPPSLLYNGYWLSLPSWHAWPVLGSTLIPIEITNQPTPYNIVLEKV